VFSAALASILCVGLLPLPPVGPTPAWVIANEVPTPTRALDGAKHLLLSDMQVRAGAQLEVYTRQVWKVVSLVGVDGLSAHELEWNPAFETLTLHGVWVVRDGVRRSAWHPDEARVLQREASLDRGLYDDALTLRLELRDVRVGDLVEVASTVTGENPVFERHLWFRMGQQLDEAVSRLAFRLRWERPGHLRWKTAGAALEPTTRLTGDVLEVSWLVEDVPAARYESDAPADTHQVPIVTFSDWGTWGDVAQFASRLFQSPKYPALASLIARFKALPEHERIGAIIRFTQDDIRYLGLERGRHSHQPHAPQWVLERGFGDCKDKSLLGVTLLRAVGVEAWPVLVDTNQGMGLVDELPAPVLFDHAILRFETFSGSHYVDVTERHRRGDPQAWEAPAFGFGLVVRPESTQLEMLPKPTSTEPTWQLHQAWQVDGDDAELVITTTASGDEAMSLRARIVGTKREEYQSDQTQARTDELERPLRFVDLTVDDDELSDRVTVVERYRVSKVVADDGSVRFRSLVAAHDLRKAPTGDRSTPFSLRFPLRVEERLTYSGPGGATVEAKSVKVDDPAFSFSATHAPGTASWKLTTRADRVSPDDLEQYREHVDEALAWSEVEFGGGRELPSVSAPTSAPINLPGWLYGVAGAFSTMVLVVLSLMAWPSLKSGLAPRQGEGEYPSAPARISLREATGLFRSASCPNGHGWGAAVLIDEPVRVGDRQVRVVRRACGVCEAKEHRYVDLR
jgi:transglutaminase-like putative cysteine protease